MVSSASFFSFASFVRVALLASVLASLVSRVDSAQGYVPPPPSSVGSGVHPCWQTCRAMTGNYDASDAASTDKAVLYNGAQCVCGSAPTCSATPLTTRAIPVIDWCRRCVDIGFGMPAACLNSGITYQNCADGEVRYHWVCLEEGCSLNGCLLEAAQLDLTNTINNAEFGKWADDSRTVSTFTGGLVNAQCKAASECPNGFVAGGSCACACAAGYGGNPCQQCVAGQFSSGGNCQQCGVNTYSSAGQSACSPCAAGTESLAGAVCCRRDLYYRQDN